MKVLAIFAILYQFLASWVKSDITVVETYQCSPEAFSSTRTEMNYLTDSGFFLGCNNTVMFKDIEPTNSATQADFQFSLPLPNVTDTNYSIVAISHKKKNPPDQLDHVYIAIGEYSSSLTIVNSWVLFLPNYLDGGNSPAPANVTAASLSGLKKFRIPNLITTVAPIPVPIILFLEAIPENSFFITADHLGQIHVIDSNEPDIPDYPTQSSIYFNSEIGKTIVALKYRDQLSKFVVCLSTGLAKMYVFNQKSTPPVEMDHESAISALEVFKFDDRILTGGTDGKMKLWDSAKLKVKLTYNKYGTYGDEVKDMAWIIGSTFFISAHANGILNIWKLSGWRKHIESLSSGGVPNYISSIETTKKFIVGFDALTGTKTFISNNINCHEFCKTCLGTSAYDCQTCFEPTYSLQTTNYCKKNCQLTNKEYYEKDGNTCKDCETGCKSCLGPLDVNCTSCLDNYYSHPNRSCHLNCQPGTYQEPGAFNCLTCHPTCKMCSGPGSHDCTQCATGLFLNLDNTCFPKCKVGSYASDPTKCSACDSSCKECSGPQSTQCVSCHNTTLYMLNTKNECVNCLTNYTYDEQICNFTRKTFLVRTPYESVDPFSSLTIKLWIDNFENYLSIVEKKVDWGKDMFDIQFEGLDGQQMTDSKDTSRLLLGKEINSEIDSLLNNRFLVSQTEEISKRYTVRRKSFVVDLNFTKTLREKSTMTVKPLKRDLVVKNQTNSDIFFLQNFIGSGEYFVKIKLNMYSALYISNLAWILNLCLLTGGGVMIIATSIMLYKEFDVTYILMDFSRMAKVLHRLKFINVDQTPLVEFFLSKVYNLFQSGLDRQRDEVDKYQHSYRGRLTEIGVPVIPLVNFSDKFLIYLLINMVYYSYSQVAKYIAIGNSERANQERRLMKVVGKIKIMVIFMICNDLIFSCSRNLLHYNLNFTNESNQAIQYYILSLLTLMLICFDLVSVAMNISNNKIMRLFMKSKRFVRLCRSRKEQYEKDLAGGLIYPDGTTKGSKDTKSSKSHAQNDDEAQNLTGKEENQLVDCVNIYKTTLYKRNEKLAKARQQLDQLKRTKAERDNLKVEDIDENFYEARKGWRERGAEESLDQLVLEFGNEIDPKKRAKLMKDEKKRLRKMYGEDLNSSQANLVMDYPFTQRNPTRNRRVKTTAVKIKIKEIGVKQPKSQQNHQKSKDTRVGLGLKRKNTVGKATLLVSGSKQKKSNILTKASNQKSLNEIHQEGRNERKPIRLSEVESTQSFSADLEFCSKGIDPGKFLNHPSSRFFNIIIVLKTALFELVIISNQQVPFLQTMVLLVIQISFYAFFLKCLFKDKIFKHNFMQYINLIFETSLLLYFSICGAEAMCKVGLTLTCTKVATRRVPLFVLLFVMSLVLLFYFLHMFWQIYMRVFRPSQASKENEIYLPEDHVEVIWEDDSQNLKEKNKEDEKEFKRLKRVYMGIDRSIKLDMVLKKTMAETIEVGQFKWNEDCQKEQEINFGNQSDN